MSAIMMALVKQMDQTFEKFWSSGRLRYELGHAMGCDAMREEVCQAREL